MNYAFVDKDGNDNFSFPKEVAQGQQYKKFRSAVTVPVVEERALFMKKCLKKLDDK